MRPIDLADSRVPYPQLSNGLDIASQLKNNIENVEQLLNSNHSNTVPQDMLLKNIK